MKKLVIASLTILECILLSFNNTSADIFDTYGLGSRGIAMGGAVCSTVEGSASVYYNPAGLGKSKGHELDINYFMTIASTDIDFDDDIDSSYVLPDDNDLQFGSFVFGAALNVNKLFNLPKNTTFGFGISTMDDLTLVEFAEIEEREFAYLRFGSPIKITTFCLGIGSEIFEDKLWVGIGARALASLDSAVLVNFDPGGLSTQEPIAPSSLDAWATVKPKSGMVLGINYKVNENANLGFLYKDEYLIDVSASPTQINVKLGTVEAVIPAKIQLVSSYNPAVYQCGGSYKINKMTIAIDIKQEKWSEFTRGSLRDDKYLQEEGAIDTTIDANDARPEFDDIISYHVGVEYAYKENINIWGGFISWPTPIPEQPGGAAGGTNYLGNDRNIISSGGEIRIDDTLGISKFPVWLGGAIQYQMLQSRHVSKNTGSDYTHEGNVISFILSARISYDAKEK